MRLHFHKIRQFLLLAVLMSAPSTAARAQNYRHYVEHDWRINVGGNSYGLVQEVLGPPDRRTTSICLGGRTFTTRLRATHMATLMFVLLVAAGFFLLAWQRKTESKS